MFFMNDKEEKLNLRNATYASMKKLMFFWEKAGVPTKPKHHIVAAIEKLYHEWRGVRKGEKKRSQAQIAKEKTFQHSLDDLFDIAHEGAMKKTKLEEDKRFLQMQRKKGRPGYMTKLDEGYAARQEARNQRRLKAENRRIASLKESAAGEGSFSSSSDSDAPKLSSDGSEEFVPPKARTKRKIDEAQPGTSGSNIKKKKRKIKISTDLVGAMDNTGQSDSNRTVKQPKCCSRRRYALSAPPRPPQSADQRCGAHAQ